MPKKLIKFWLDKKSFFLHRINAVSTHCGETYEQSNLRPLERKIFNATKKDREECFQINKKKKKTIIAYEKEVAVDTNNWDFSYTHSMAFWRTFFPESTEIRFLDFNNDLIEKPKKMRALRWNVKDNGYSALDKVKPNEKIYTSKLSFLKLKKHDPFPIFYK